MKIVDALDRHPDESESAGTTRGVQIREVQLLGVHPPRRQHERPIAVYYLRYGSKVDGGAVQAAKLFVPMGTRPEHGWPTSVWIHGLGDPAMQLRRWPLVAGQDWRKTRGELAGRWAHHGIITLAPWLPGDGPSEPLGTYSPLSLARNAQAAADAFAALRNVSREYGGRGLAAESDAAYPRIDTCQLILRGDCIAGPTLVYFAVRAEEYRVKLLALVADDFLPSIACNESYLGPFLGRLPPLASAAIRLTWMRALWALAKHSGISSKMFFSTAAIELFSAQVPTTVGPLDRLMASVLVPPRRSELADSVVHAVQQDIGGVPNGQQIRNWIYSPSMADWASRSTLDRIVSHDFYIRYLADSDPFFTPASLLPAPRAPLLVVARRGNTRTSDGLPGFQERNRYMLVPKLIVLRENEWSLEVHERRTDYGTSFSGGELQHVVLGRLRELAEDSKSTGCVCK